MGWGYTADARQGRGQQMGPQRGTFGVDADRVSLSSKRDHFQKHSSTARSLSGPRAPSSSTTPAPAPPRA